MIGLTVLIAFALEVLVIADVESILVWNGVCLVVSEVDSINFAVVVTILV